MVLLKSEQLTFHQVKLKEIKRDLFYIMKVNPEDTIAVECIEDFNPQNIESYIHYHIDEVQLRVQELASIKGSADKVVAVYMDIHTMDTHPSSAELYHLKHNPIISKLIKRDVQGIAFLCCIDTKTHVLKGMTEAVKRDLLLALEKTFEHQRALHIVEGYTVRRFTGISGERELVFSEAIKTFLGDDEIFASIYKHCNEDTSEDTYYRSQSEQYFIACHQEPVTPRLGVAIFKQAETVVRSIDKKAQNKLEYTEALQILNGRLVNMRAATVRMLEDVVKLYLEERGYEYRKIGDTNSQVRYVQPGAVVGGNQEDIKEVWLAPRFGERDCIYVGPYKDGYYASVELVDHTWLFIDCVVTKKEVQLAVYEEVMYKLYDMTESVNK